MKEPNTWTEPAYGPGGELVICRGLPGSGKSTWVDNLTTPRTVVCRDDIRAELRANGCRSRHHKFEATVRDLRDQRILQGLVTGQPRPVYCTDTNLIPSTYSHLVEKFKSVASSIQVLEFDTEVVECIERDAQRDRTVGRDVIMRMFFDTYLFPRSLKKWNRPIEGPRESAFIVDIDGTIAQNPTRGAYEWHRVGSDAFIEPVCELVDLLIQSGKTPLFVTARPETARYATLEWLSRRWFNPLLFMRLDNDFRRGWIVKREIFHDQIREHYNVEYVLEDHPPVVDMWRSIGLTVYDVGCRYRGKTQ